MYKKHLLIGLALIIIPVILLVSEHLYLSHARSIKQVTVNYSDASSVELWHGKDRTQSNIASGESLNIKLQDDSYYLKYSGADGFADGKTPIPKNADEVSIVPAYSEEVLVDMYRDEKSAIVAQLYDTYPDARELYIIKNDRLYQRGDWFGAVLEYKGDSFYSRDSLGLIMRKTDDKWTLVTEPPMPSVNIHAYPDTPIELLDSLNTQLFS